MTIDGVEIVVQDVEIGGDNVLSVGMDTWSQLDLGAVSPASAFAAKEGEGLRFKILVHANSQPNTTLSQEVAEMMHVEAGDKIVVYAD